jgi:hypothetical protein
VKDLDVLAGSDIIDVREITERVEELEGEREGLEAACHEDGPEDTNVLGKLEELAAWDEENGEELAQLRGLLDELAGCGGDHEWRGQWYPLTLIRDSHFEDHAREIASDLHGREVENSSWPFSCIDWAGAAEALQQDYSAVEYGGITYWYR